MGMVVEMDLDGWRWISAASGCGCCVRGSLGATSVANLIWGPSRKLLVSRRRRRWHTVRSDGTGGSRGAPPVPGRAGAQSDQLRDLVDLVLPATRKYP